MSSAPSFYMVRIFYLSAGVSGLVATKSTSCGNLSSPSREIYSRPSYWTFTAILALYFDLGLSPNYSTIGSL